MDYTSDVKLVVTEFLDQMGLTDQVTVEITFDQADKLYLISLHTNTPALLIGFHGENLAAAQLVLGQHLHAKLGEWVNLSLNVNDYRERRESALHALADSAVARVISTGQPHSLPPMPANERRIIHLYLAENAQVATTSQGEGRSRSVVISPKAAV